MTLEFKADFDQARQRWDALWKGVNTRPILLMSIPKWGVRKVVAPPSFKSLFDGALTPLIDQLLAWAETHEFLGESIPSFCLHFGPDTMAAYLGADLKLAPDEGESGSWAVPFVEDLDKTEIAFKRDGHWWRRTVEFGQALRQRCDGKLFITGPTLAANLDVLAAIRGREELLVDLVEKPEAVKRVLDEICRAHSEIIQALAELLDWDRLGSVGGHGTYAAGRQSAPQCDFSCMISPEMFRKFAIPCLRREGDDTHAFVYHLDGPGAIRHLPALCELEKLAIISYVPGQPGQPGREHERSLRSEIDKRGKGQWFSFKDDRDSGCGWKKEEIKRAWQTFKSRQLIFVATVLSRTEAEDLIGELEDLPKEPDASEKKTHKTAKAPPPIDATQFMWTPCDLTGLLNRPLADEVDGDGTGGWTDQGPLMDLRNLHAGDYTFNNVAFRVAKGNACFIMKNKMRPSESLPDSGMKALNFKADMLAFLHSGGWLTYGIRHATYVIHYADGQKVEIPVISGGNIFDWAFGPAMLEGLTYNPDLGFTQHAIAVKVPMFVFGHIWMTLWKNPNSKKEIRALEVIGEDEGIPGLLAVSRGTALCRR